MGKKKKKAKKEKLTRRTVVDRWVEARRRHGISDAAITMAVALGWRPENLQKYEQRRVKKKFGHLEKYIGMVYRNQFRREPLRPGDVPPIEEAYAAKKLKRQTRREEIRCGLRKPRGTGRGVYIRAADSINQARERAGLSIDDLGRLLDYTPFEMRKLSLDRPKRSKPSLATMYYVAHALGLRFVFGFESVADDAEDEYPDEAA